MCPAEEQNTDKASVMIIAVSLPVASPWEKPDASACAREKGETKAELYW